MADSVEAVLADNAESPKETTLINNNNGTDDGDGNNDEDGNTANNVTTTTTTTTTPLTNHNNNKSVSPSCTNIKNIIDEHLAKECQEMDSMSPVEITKEKLQEEVHSMKREDIENLIVDKIIESIKMHSSVSALHNKLMDAMAHKDKLFHRVNNLHRQVTELTKAVRSMSENVGRQKTNGKNAQPIRFYRSVGLQVTYDSPLKPLNEKTTNSEPIEQSRRSILKQGNYQQYNNNHQMPPSFNNILEKNIHTMTAASILNLPQPGQKRTINKPLVSVGDVAKQVEIENQNKLRKLSNNSDIIEINGTLNSSATVHNNNNNNTSTLILNSVVLPNNHIKQPNNNSNNLTNNGSRLGTPTSNTNNATNNSEQNNKKSTSSSSSDVVDLTDDDKDMSISPTNSSNTTPTPNQNSGGQQQQQQVIMVASQPRPIQMLNNRPRGPNQPLVVRGMVQHNNNVVQLNGQYYQVKVPVSSQNPTSLRIPSGNNINIPNNNQSVRPPVQNVMTRPPGGYRSSSTPEGPRKFVLPPLPPPSVIGTPRRCLKDIPPRPELTLAEQKEGIVLSWTLKIHQNHSEIQTYQIYACQEPLVQTGAVKQTSWKKVGDVKALPLPMACTLSQFADENRYHFIVRGVDVYNRTGPFCEVVAITLKKKLQ